MICEFCRQPTEDLRALRLPVFDVVVKGLACAACRTVTVPAASPIPGP